MPDTRPITPLLPPAQLMTTLAPWRQLPILPGTQEKVLASLHHPHATAESVSEACQQDPVLLLQLWLNINQALLNSGNELHHLAHGISLLGLPKTEQIVRNAAQMITPNPGYLECLMHSELSHWLAARLTTLEAVEKERWSVSVLFSRCHEWALWHHYPKHMLQRRGLLIGTVNDEDIQSTESLLFGKPLRAIGSELCQQWPLPQPLKKAWTQDTQALIDGSEACLDDQLRLWLQQHPSQEQVFFSRSSSLWLINHLGQSLANNAHSDDSLNTQSVLARQMIKSRDTIIALSHQAMVHSQTPLHQWPHPASRLLQHWSVESAVEALSLQTTELPPSSVASTPADHLQNTEQEPHRVQATLTAFRELAQVSESGDVTEISLPSTEPRGDRQNDEPNADKSERLTSMPEFLELPSSPIHKNIAPDSAAAHPQTTPQNNPDSPQYTPPKPDIIPPAPFRNDTLLEDHLKRLLERGNQFHNLNQLLLFALETLAEGLGLQQVVIMVIHDQQTLRSHYCRGLEDDDTLRHLHFSLDTETQQGIIGQLFKQAAALNINSANIKLVQSRAPKPLRPHLKANTTALMSLFRNQSPIGLVYISDNNLQAKQFQQFKRVCNATSKAITAFAQRRYQQPSPN
jgi:HD-like signal output (HDOD) protein